MFQNRGEAGQRLAESLTRYRQPNTIVLGLTPGGVEVGYHVAKNLDVAFSVLITSRLRYPNNPEAAFGAVAEDGSVYMAGFAKKDLVQETIDQIVADRLKEIDRRKSVLREGKPFPNIYHKKVILASDGIMTAARLQAAIELCKKHETAGIIVAAPFAEKNIVAQMKTLVEDVVILKTCRHCQSISREYMDYPDLTDEDLKRFLDRWEMEHQRGID